MNVPVDTLRNLGFKLVVSSLPLEFAWNAHTKMFVLEGVETSAQALAILSAIAGEPVTLGAINVQATATVAAQQQAPVQQQAAPAQQTAQQQPVLPFGDPGVPQTIQQSAQAPQTIPGPAQPTGPAVHAQNNQTPAPAAAQAQNPALPEDAVFGRMQKVMEVVTELVKRGARTEEAVVAQAKALRARGASPLLTSIDADEFDQRIHFNAMSALALASAS